MNQQAILNHIDDVLDQWVNEGWNLSDSNDNYSTGIMVATNLMATIDALAPSGSRYLINAEKVIANYGEFSSNGMEILAGILRSLRIAYEKGYLRQVTELIHADVFNDFLETSEYFLEEGYKDPAAVMAGGVLEEHLRKLCQKNNIPTVEPTKSGHRPKKAESMNTELAGVSVYSKLDQKSVTAWLDLRNKAAHAKYTEYVEGQVSLMLQGIRDFIIRHPA
jgi:hypothetical protein